MAFKDVLKSLRKEKGFTQEQLADEMGLSKSAISMYETGNRKPDYEALEAFAGMFNVDMNTLLDSPSSKNLSLPNSENIIPLPTTYTVPLLGEIACGKPILAEENIEGMVKVPEYIQADFALRCKGDSMIGARILDGDIVYIRQQPDVDDGEIAAVLIDNEATLKRVYKMPGRLQLRAENPAFLPINLEGDELETVRILGKAVAFTSSVK